MASLNELLGFAGGLGAAGNPFSQIGQGQAAQQNNQMNALINQQMNALINQQMAAQHQQMNALINQQMAAQHQQREQREQEMRRIQAIYPHFDPDPRDPKKCSPPKAIPREYPGKIYKVDNSATMKFTAVSDPSCWTWPPTNREKLRAEVAAWTRRVA